MTNENTLTKVLTFIHRQINLRWDCFVVVTGGEGVGKSVGMFLNIIRIWYEDILHKPIPKYSVRIDTGDFVKSLSVAKRYDIVGLDEASDELDTSKRYDQFNQFLYLTYNIIRGKGFFTLMVLPSFFDLAPRFRNRRVRYVFDVYERINNYCHSCTEQSEDDDGEPKTSPLEFTGARCPQCGATKYARGFIKWRLYGRQELNRIIEKTASLKVPSFSAARVKPIARGIAYEYTGPLLEGYLIAKEAKMDSTIHRLGNLAKDIRREDTDYGRCPRCGSKEVRFAKRAEKMNCRKCGKLWSSKKVGGGAQ